MKVKVATNEEDYKQIVLKRTIIMCWVLLAICFIIKIVGGNFFEIMCHNQQFITFCEYVDKIVWLQFIFGCISSYITMSLFWLAICHKLWFTTKETIFIAIIIPLSVAARMSNEVVNFIMNIVMLFAVPFVFKRYYKIKDIKSFIVVLVYANILNFAFQLVSIIVKNLGMYVLTDNFLVSIIFAIDVYIMLVLYYLYSNYNKGGNRFMSWFLSWLFNKDVDALKQMREEAIKKQEKIKDNKDKNSIKKVSLLKTEIAALDEVIKIKECKE